MKYVIDELSKALKYNRRQLDENLSKIRSSEENITDLKLRNERHIQAINEISEYIETLEKDSELQLNLPNEKQSTSSIEE